MGLGQQPDGQTPPRSEGVHVLVSFFFLLMNFLTKRGKLREGETRLRASPSRSDSLTMPSTYAITGSNGFIAAHRALRPAHRTLEPP